MPTTKSPKVVPVLSHYFGAKSEFIDWYLDRCPPHTASVELCAGMASFTLRKQRAPVEVINDKDGIISAMFEVVRDHAGELSAMVEATPYARAEWLRCVAKVAQFRKEIGYGPAWDKLSDRERIEYARAYLVSIRQSGSRKTGMYWSRAIHHSRRGVSSSVSRWLNLSEDLREVSDRLSEVQIESLDLLDCIRKYDRPGTLFFIDPPYLPEVRPNTSEAYPCEMTREGHEAMIALLVTIKGGAIVCGYASALYDDNLTEDNGWARYERDVSCRSAVGHNGRIAARSTRREVAWIKQ